LKADREKRNEKMKRTPLLERMALHQKNKMYSLPTFQKKGLVIGMTRPFQAGRSPFS